MREILVIPVDMMMLITNKKLPAHVLQLNVFEETYHYSRPQVLIVENTGSNTAFYFPRIFPALLQFVTLGHV
jgi:hypothetical protein